MLHNIWGSGGIIPRILNLGSRRKRVFSFTPRPLPSGKEPRCPLGLQLGVPQNRYGRYGKQKNRGPMNVNFTGHPPPGLLIMLIIHTCFNYSTQQSPSLTNFTYL